MCAEKIGLGGPLGPVPIRRLNEYLCKSMKRKGSQVLQPSGNPNIYNIDSKSLKSYDAVVRRPETLVFEALKRRMHRPSSGENNLKISIGKF